MSSFGAFFFLTRSLADGPLLFFYRRGSTPPSLPTPFCFVENLCLEGFFQTTLSIKTIGSGMMQSPLLFTRSRQNQLPLVGISFTDAPPLLLSLFPSVTHFFKFFRMSDTTPLLPAPTCGLKFPQMGNFFLDFSLLMLLVAFSVPCCPHSEHLGRHFRLLSLRLS